jgi:hypothetical protein
MVDIPPSPMKPRGVRPNDSRPLLGHGERLAPCCEAARQRAPPPSRGTAAATDVTHPTGGAPHRCLGWWMDLPRRGHASTLETVGFCRWTRGSRGGDSGFSVSLGRNVPCLSASIISIKFIPTMMHLMFAS